jgi:hypothetical protein
MAPRPPSLLPDVVAMWLVGAAACTAVVILMSTMAARVRSKGRAASQRREVGTAEAFALAVAQGDFTRAETEAKRAFEKRRTKGDTPTRRHS